MQLFVLTVTFLKLKITWNSNLMQAERLEEPAEEEDLWDITVSGAVFYREI